MKQKEIEKENRFADDLGFEINYGAFQPMAKVSFCRKCFNFRHRLCVTLIFTFKLPIKKIKEPLTEKTNKGVKKVTEKRGEDVPKEFVQKIKNLGMKVEDAEVLFKSKVDWTAVYSENKIYCAEPGCDFTTIIDSVELTNHMIDVHQYGDYPCTDEHCDYVAASKV